MKINGKECLPVLSCDVKNQPFLTLDKGAALRLMNGEPIRFDRVAVKFTFLKLNEKGHPFIVDGIVQTTTVEDMFVAFEIGVIKEEK